jgi:molybdopterin-guanine dinucleotide biosynthesis protein A
MRIAGLIIAGGKAVRMGADKPFAPFGGGVLLDAAIARAEPQVERLMLNVRPEHMGRCQSHYGEKFMLLPDAFDGTAGPLGGVVAGLQELPSLGADWLATFPCDTPFLPMDLVAWLKAAAQTSSGVPIVAVAAGKVQSLCALWPLPCLDVLREGVTSGEFRSVWWALDALKAERVEILAEPHTFFNVNTAEDLAEAENLACRNDDRA